MKPQTISKGGVPVKLDEDLKPRLIAAAVDELRSLNDLLVGIVAERFSFEHERSGVPGGVPSATKLVVNLDMPLELRDAINDANERENRRRRHQGKPRRNRSTYLNGIFRAHLDGDG